MTEPVQARDEAGIPLFIHACGHVSPESTPGVDEGEHHRFPPCRTPGPWRPLLVGGDLADPMVQRLSADAVALISERTGRRYTLDDWYRAAVAAAMDFWRNR
jgi:hypothetical protein